MTTDPAVVALVATLEQIRQVSPRDKAVWDDRLVARLAVERLWITAGNLTESCRVERGLSAGVEPWSVLVGHRHLLAHALPGDISSDRVFADTAADLEPMPDAVRAQMS